MNIDFLKRLLLFFGLMLVQALVLNPVQPYLLELFIQHGDNDEVFPSIRELGLSKFTLFALILTFVYCLVFFTLESFTFFNWLQWLLSIFTSLLLTLLLVLVVDNLRRF